MKKIDEAIMILRSIPEDKLDAVIDALYAFSKTPPQKTSGPADIICFPGNLPEDKGED